jgi:nucleoside-diphosphate-sugar epimerase
VSERANIFRSQFTLNRLSFPPDGRSIIPIELLGKSAQNDFQPMHRADIGKAERLLGWRPQVMTGEGIRRLVAWYQANRAWAGEVATG